MRRRSLLIGTLLGAPLSATQAQGLGPLRLAADVALVDSGLARALQQGFSRDTGIGVRLVAVPALPLLEALAAGEHDVGLTNAPQAEERLDGQGLVHDRRPIASGAFLLVGPMPKSRPRQHGDGRSIADALMRLHPTFAAASSGAAFLSGGDGSGAHVVEQAAWRAAQIAPEAPWYAAAAPGSNLIAQARARGACAIVERGAWLSHGGAPLAVLVDGDPLATESVHAMRSFRSPHPAGKLFVAWIAGGQGRAVVATQRGYRRPTP
jgi:tungstate transport system substrate-binding protein